MTLSIFGDDGVTGSDGADGENATSATTAAQGGADAQSGTAGQAVTLSLSSENFDPATTSVHMVAGQGGSGGEGGNSGLGLSDWIVDGSFVYDGATYVTHRTGRSSLNGTGGDGGAGANGGAAALALSASASYLSAVVVAGAGGFGHAGGHGGVALNANSYHLSRLDLYPGGTFAYSEDAVGSAGGNGGRGGDAGDGAAATIDVGNAAYSGLDLTALSSSWTAITVGGGRGGNGGGDGQLYPYSASVGGDGGDGGDGGNGGNAAVSVHDTQMTFGYVGYNFKVVAGDGTRGGDGGPAGRGHSYTDDNGTVTIVTHDGAAGDGGDGGNGGNASISFVNNFISGSGALNLSFTLTGGARGTGGMGGNNYDGVQTGQDGANGSFGATSLTFVGNRVTGDGAGDFNLTLRNTVNVNNWYDGDADLTGFKALGGMSVNLTNGIIYYFVDGQHNYNQIGGIANVTLNVTDGWYDGTGAFHNRAAPAALTGDAANNRLVSSAGNDILIGYAGDDVLDGNTGVDQMTGGFGDDSFYVDNIGDLVIEASGQGTDIIFSTVTYSLAVANRSVENLTLTGGDAINATGNNFNNVLTGNLNNNLLNGGVGADTLSGGFGNDTYVVDNAGDVVSDFGGTDTVISSIAYVLAVDLENLTLNGTAAVNGTGNALDNILTGNAAINLLTGGTGNDSLNGGQGTDTLSGGLGNDTFVVDNSADVVTESSGQGTDLVLASATFTLLTHVEALTLTGSAGISGTGNGLNNSLTGNGGNNTLNGSLGADTLIGGLGSDLYIVDNVGDVVTEVAGPGTDTVQSTVSFVLGANVENLTLAGAGNINGTGNTLANTLYGNGGNNVLSGGGGVDKLYGRGGNDTYIVDNAGVGVSEALNGGDAGGADQVMSSISWTLGAYIENLTLTGTAVINGVGNALANSLVGNTANNYLTGAAANDTLTGGGGYDTFVFGLGSGADIITDFTAAQNDRINIHAYSGGVVDGGGVVISQVGDDVRVDLGGGNMVTLLNTAVAALNGHIVW